ncbi:hypothetical protein [Mesorhizobium sp. CN2-181]|uniref:hypothetical protein n=1 Tax=Mesorhizobium yinganensis TaxID=3157707 RepID=UPI0032B74773
MIRLLALSLLAGSVLTGASAADVKLAPGSAYSVHLADVDGVVYYSIDKDGYRVVATLASGVDNLPVRVVSTLTPGQRMSLSVPGALGEPALDVEILHDGHSLVVSDPASETKDAVSKFGNGAPQLPPS